MMSNGEWHQKQRTIAAACEKEGAGCLTCRVEEPWPAD